MVLTGFYIWWPKKGQFRKAITIKRNASSQRFYFDLHKMFGVYSSIILLVIAFSGFWFAYSDYIKPVVSFFSEVNIEQYKDPEAVKSQRTGSAPSITIKQAIAIADSVFPNAKLRWLTIPDGNEGVFAIEKRQVDEINQNRPRSKVWIDQYTGKVLAVEDPEQFTAGESFFNLMWLLHNGEVFGLLGRIIWCIVGLIPLVLYVTGIIRWLQKRKAKKSRKIKQSKITIS